MPAFARSGDNESDIRLTILVHTTILGVLKTPGFAGIIDQLDNAGYRQALKAEYDADPAGTLHRLHFALPVGTTASMFTSDESWRVELQVPISGHWLIFGLDSVKGYFSRPAQ